MKTLISLLVIVAVALVFILVRERRGTEGVAAVPPANQEVRLDPPTEPVRVHVVPVPPASEPVKAATEPEAPPRQAGSIRGTLFDHQGERVPFRLLTFNCRSDPQPPRRRRIVTTDDRGDYWLKDVPTGTWRASCAPQGMRSSTYLAETEVWNDTAMPLDLFLRGTHVISGNLTRESQGLGLEITLRDFFSGRVVAETLAVTLQPALTEQADPENLQPRFLPGYFELGALPGSKYVLSAFPSVNDFPEELRRITKQIEILVDLRVDEQVLIPPRSFSWEDFGLHNVVELVPVAAGADAGEPGEQLDDSVGTDGTTAPKSGR